MISSFTPDGPGLVSMWLRSRHLADTAVEEIEAEVPLDLADAAPGSCSGLRREARGAAPGGPPLS